MNRIHVTLATAVAVVGLEACAVHGSPPNATGSHPASATGLLPATGALTIDVGVSRVRLVVEHRDSIFWSLETKPAGCAVAEASPNRIALARRDQHCATSWNIRIPAIDDVQVRASVGDIDVSAPADRALRLHAGVGSVRLRFDDRELRHAGSPGSGDHLDLGDLGTLPRLDVRTGVGSVRAELRTVERR
jgi:hypothetical protein